MSRRRRNNKWGWIILAIIILSSLKGLSGLGTLAIILGFVLAFFALVFGFVGKIINNGTKDYAEVDRNRNKQNSNPYSNGAYQATQQKQSNQQTVILNGKPVDGNGNANPYGQNIHYTTTPVNEVNNTPKTEPKKKTTGDAEIDKLIDDKDKAIKEMHRLNKAIENPTITEQIDHLEAVTDKIMDYVIEHPEKKKQVNKFFSYYLPTTLKLLNAYDRADDAGISGMNIDDTKGKVEDMMGTALDAFDKQLDALFAEEALDVSTDISVMQNMLRSEGLVDDELMKKAKELAKAGEE